jgi:hypothetical protein
MMTYQNTLLSDYDFHGKLNNSMVVNVSVAI